MKVCNSAGYYLIVIIIMTQKRMFMRSLEYLVFPFQNIGYPLPIYYYCQSPTKSSSPKVEHAGFQPLPTALYEY